MRECEARRCLTVCAVQGRRWHVMPDEVRLYVLSKVDDGMQRLTLSDHVCSPRTMMACHARRSLIVYVFKGRL